MKKIVNIKVKPYFTLPNGVTITHGGSTDVVHEAILESPEVKKAKDKGLIRIEDETEPSTGESA